MAPKDPSDCVVTVTIELGHQAHFLKEPSPEGFTHDWTVFVRGQEGSRLEAFVEKVVFRLHKTFKCPLRTISEPPYKVSESGYAGFLLPIEIHFKNKQSPRKIIFSYDLFLNAVDSPPINNVRIEKLKFQNPTPEFKAKLLKAGGIEQGADPIPHAIAEPFPPVVKTDHKKLSKPPKDKEKKRKKKSPPKSVSPDSSLSSLSSTSSDEDDNDHRNPPPPPPPPKKEKESSHKKGSSSSHAKPDNSSSTSHKDKPKHRSNSTSLSHKERPNLELDISHKSHKHKSRDKDGERSSSSHKDHRKMERESSSLKVPKELSEVRKDREGSHSSTKSSASSSLSDKKNSVPVAPVKEKEKSSKEKDRDSTPSSHKEKKSSSSKEKDKEKSSSSSSHKLKHSSVKEAFATSSEQKKPKLDIIEVRPSKEKDGHISKSHKRPQEIPAEEVSDKKKLKRSASLVSTEEKPSKTKNEVGKEKVSNLSKETRDKESHKEKREKDSKSSSTSSKSKHEKSKHSDKHRQGHSSESKHKENKEKDSFSKTVKTKHDKTSKSESTIKSERLAMTADFQPQLMLSPLKNKSSDDSRDPSPVPLAKPKQLVSSKSNSSLSSLSSDHELDVDKSDNDTPEAQEEKAKHIVSGLTDSDSDSDEELSVERSPKKELKTALIKQPQQLPESGKTSPVKRSSPVVVPENSKKHNSESPADEVAKKKHKHYKESKPAPSRKDDVKRAKEKSVDPKPGDPGEVICTAAQNNDEKGGQGGKGLDILAPNGIPLEELMSINEKIEKAQIEANRNLLDRVVEIIGNTDDFDYDDASVFFDICSVDKNIVSQIQMALQEYCC